MLASLLAAASLAAPSSPLGDTLADPLAAGSPATTASNRIDTVRIVRHGALEGAKILTAGDSLAYDVAEWLRDHVLHSRTSEATIRRRLILGKGDMADSVHLKEAGRLLRLEKFLAEAKVDTFRQDDGKLALQAESWDRWSSAVIASLNRAGGELSWSLGRRESNLLGTGQDVGFAYSSTELRKGWWFNYLNSALFVPGGQLAVTYVDQTDGHDFFGSFGLPNRSRYQTWAWNIDFTDRTSEKRILATPGLKARFSELYGAKWTKDALFSTMPESRYRFVRGYVAKLWGDGIRTALSLVGETEMDSATRPFGGFSVRDSSALAGIRRDPEFKDWMSRPPQRDDARLGLALSLRGLDHVRLRNFNQLKWTEDVALGWQWTGNVMANVRSTGDLRDDGYLWTTFSWTGMTGSLYHSASAGWKSFFEDGDAGQGSSNARLELRWLPSSKLQLLGALSNDAVYAQPVWNSQLSLGEDNGLPGYDARSLTGRGRILATSELRWTPPLEAFTVAPALALFVGTGRISDQPGILGDGPWKTGAGIGLRFGMTRSATGIVNHLSISRPIGDPDHASWLVSFGAKQSL